MTRKQSVQRATQLRVLIRLVAGLVGLAVLVGVPLAAPASEEVPGPIVDGVGEALDGWARYATSGDLVALGASFVVGGPQWRQLQAESDQAEGGASEPPLRFEIRQFRLRHLDTDTATVWVEVEASRTGFVSKVFGWDFDLILDNGQWRVWTVVAAEAPSESAQVAADPDPAEPVPTTTSAPPTSPTVPQSTMAGGALTASAAGQSRGTRIPVLSAWVVVVTVVGVAIAGYMAPRIDRRGEG